MLVKSTLLSGMSGKLAGTVFSRGRSGQVARAWAKPSNPKTVLQQAVRAALATAAAAFAVLTAGQRSAWQAYADTQTVMNRLGEAINLTGQNIFVRVNTVLAQAGRSQITTPPPAPGGTSLMAPFVLGVTFAAPAPAAVQVVATIASGASWRSTTTSTLMVYTSRPQSPGRNAPIGGYALSATIPGNATPPTTLNCPIRGGASVQVGEKVFIKMHVVNANGEISGESIISVTSA